MPRLLKSVLGLSHKFIVTPEFTIKDGETLEESLDRFCRDVYLKVYFADEPMDNKPPTFYMKSTWRPDEWSIPREVNERLAAFFRGLRKLFAKKRGCSNLLPHQRKILSWLRKQTDYIVAKTDKGLGPCTVEYSRYVMDCLAHISNVAVYQIISKAEADHMACELLRTINKWLHVCRKWLSDDERKWISHHSHRNSGDPHGYFYVMYKIHKSPIKTRPVVSDCASVTNPLGKWVDVMLQPFAKSMETYFKDSFELKSIIDQFIVPLGGRLFVIDAESMYTNIDTDVALLAIAEYLRDDETNRQFSHYHDETLISALEIVMKNSIFRFGDIYARQISGTAMGKPCAPAWATIFEGLRVTKFLPLWREHLPLYKRFIDDVIAVWAPTSTDPTTDDLEFEAFKATVNDNHCLNWIASKRGMRQDYMDLTVTIVGDRLHLTV